MNHDVPSRRNLRPIAPQNFADAAANAIAHHCATQSFLDADAESTYAARPLSFMPGGLIAGTARRQCLLRPEENCELRARAALARAVYGFVIGGSQQAHGTRKILPRTVQISKLA